MSKYYMVVLSLESFCVVCKKVPFTKNLYKEIITDKIIYPQSKNTEGKLTYDYLPNGHPRCYQMTNGQTKEWLYNLNSEKYVCELERIEYIKRIGHKVEIDEKKVYKKMEKQTDEDIKIMLIKKRR